MAGLVEKIFDNLPNSGGGKNMCYFRSNPVYMFVRMSNSKLRLTCAVLSSRNNNNHYECFSCEFSSTNVEEFLTDDVGIEIECDSFEDKESSLAQCFSDAICGDIQFDVKSSNNNSNSSSSSRRNKPSISASLKLHFTIGDLAPVTHIMKLAYVEDGDILCELFEDFVAPMLNPNTVTFKLSCISYRKVFFSFFSFCSI
jgi:hypothetical protein